MVAHPSRIPRAKFTNAVAMVGQGQLIGTIHLARIGNTPAFTAQDLTALEALCSHVSACLAGLRQPARMSSSLLVQRLTPRELQIANLVTKGLTDAEIGAELLITQNTVKQALKRMFRKLDIASRTEMIAKLQVS